SSQRLRSLLQIDRAGHHRDRHTRDRGILELRPSEFLSAQPRHLQVEQHETRDVGRTMAHGPEQMQRLETVFGADGMKPFAGEQCRQHLADVRVVFDDEDIAGRSHAAQLYRISRVCGATSPNRVIVQPMTAEPAPISYVEFQRVDIRVGRIVEVEDFPAARKPAYKLRIDFGAAIGVKKSSAQVTKYYTKEELLN